jgi:hypothetical protein
MENGETSRDGECSIPPLMSCSNLNKIGSFLHGIAAPRQSEDSVSIDAWG